MEVIQEEIKINESKIDDNNTEPVSVLEDRSIKLVESNEITPAMYDKMAEFMFKFGVNTFYKSKEKHSVMHE